jgi:uncharacterized LabA/DUF88 family protein
MDLLYTGNFDGFCLVSSDSDFTPLASRIRESGLVVYGFGDKKTPEAFVAACNKFIYTNILENDRETSNNQNLKGNKKLIELLQRAYESVADEDGWAHLGPVGSQLTNLSPSFDARNYGYSKLSKLIEAVDIFEIKKPSKHIMIKLK